MNVHGCGIGWYARERCGLVDELGLDAYNRPTGYITVAAPSHDRNLRALSKTISSSLLFGHVRAAGPGASVHQYNCHPFFKGRYMFMHNGDITDFSKVRRGLQHQLRDDLFDHMSGTTDSELLFLLILNRLPDCHTQQDPATLQQAVLDAFCAVIQANRGKANSLNIAFTDGETTIATRYRNSDVEEPPSLYYHVGPMPGESAWDLNNADLGSFDAMETDPNVHDHRGALTPARDATTRTGTYRNRNGMRGEKFVATQALLVSSEPLTGGKGLDRWELLPSNSMIVAAPTRPTVGRCTRAALVAKLKEIGAGGGRRHNLSESSAPVLEIEVKCIRSLCRDALGDECPETARGVSDARAEASASETPRFADSPQVASPTRRDDAGAFSGAFGSRDAPSGERSGGSFVAVSAMPSATNPGGGTAAHANAETCFHSCPQTCRNRTGCGYNASMTLVRCGDPAIAHALVSVTSNALACLPLWPYDPVAVTGAYRLGSAKPGVAYDPRGTRSRLRAAKLCSNLACQNDAARREPVASEVQTRVKLECGLTATRIPANTSRDKGTPLVAAAWLTSDPPGAPEPSPRSTEDPFGLTRAPAPTDTEESFFPGSDNERASILARPAPAAPSKSMRSSSPPHPSADPETSGSLRVGPPSAPSGSYGSAAAVSPAPLTRDRPNKSVSSLFGAETIAPNPSPSASA